MTVIADITMSLDGYVTGPEPGRESGLGRDGEILHTWAFRSRESPEDRAFLEASSRYGALIMGRRTFDFVDGPNGWNDEIGFGYDADPSAAPARFVVTHDPPATTRLPGFAFVTAGLDHAVAQARIDAGDRDVSIMGGGDVVRQAVEQRLCDELLIHLAPVILGAGTRLFAREGPKIELDPVEVVTTPFATHIRYRVPSST